MQDRGKQLAFSARYQEDRLGSPSDRSSARQWSPEASPARQHTSSAEGAVSRNHRVRFTVQNVPPSPFVYNQRHPKIHSPGTQYRTDGGSDENDSSSYNRSRSGSEQNGGVWSAPEMSRSKSPSKSFKSPLDRTITRKANSARSGKARRAEAKKPKKTSPTRKPAWDTDVTHSSSLFDGSMKKTTLFQPRPGDRKQEAESEMAHLRDRPSSLARKQAHPVGHAKSVRTVKSTIVTTPPQRMPPRPAKDFVRLNYERITGRPFERSVKKKTHSPPSSTRLSVFERLSTPQISKSVLLRSLPFDGSTVPPQVSRAATSREETQRLTKDAALSPISPRAIQDHASTPSPRPSILVDSPRVNSSPNQEQSPRSSVRSSPRSQHASSSRSPRHIGASSSSNQSYGARVFAVLDRQGRGRIGVNQILDGLRLLGLPATHNQISDYVYLIHEGDRNTISAEEWEILVGTLDAASQPSSVSPSRNDRQMPYAQSLSPARENMSVWSNFRESHADSPRSLRSSKSSPSRKPGNLGARDTADFDANAGGPAGVHFAQEADSSPDPNIGGPDCYIEEIQRRVEGMFQQAEATAALRWRQEPGNNQIDAQNAHRDLVLKRAASVVYNLKASLFPLVSQAEELLREIQKRHGARLSLVLPQGSISAIANHSDVLASAILDDILLDTAQMLNAEEKWKSQRQVELHHADQLDAILDQIKQIEENEDLLIQQGLALGYSVPSQLNLFAVTRDQQSEQSVHPSADMVDAAPALNRSQLVLPLGVVMDIDVPKQDKRVHEAFWQEPGSGLVHTREYECSSSPSRRATRTISTSILQGRRYFSLEKRRQKYQQHRRLVEASLAGTGMDQCAVIEMQVKSYSLVSGNCLLHFAHIAILLLMNRLEDMLTDELVGECTTELDASVTSLADALATTLI